MDKKSLLSDYVKLLDLLEDYYTDGEKTNRVRLPEQLRIPKLERPAAQVGASSVKGPALKPQARSQQPGPPVTPSAGLTALAREITACTKCPLCQHRRLPVPGDGTHEPLVLVIGEAPDGEEDRMGLPFVGETGQYLDKWLNAVHWGPSGEQQQVLTRDDNIFLTTVVKCHTPDNRPPAPAELAACLPYLERQIDLLKPKAILTVGRFAPEVLLKRPVDIATLRGKCYSYHDIPLVPTYHPTAVLQNQQQLRPLVWHDLKLLINILEKV